MGHLWCGSPCSRCALGACLWFWGYMWRVSLLNLGGLWGLGALIEFILCSGLPYLFWGYPCGRRPFAPPWEIFQDILPLLFECSVGCTLPGLGDSFEVACTGSCTVLPCLSCSSSAFGHTSLCFEGTLDGVPFGYFHLLQMVFLGWSVRGFHVLLACTSGCCWVCLHLVWPMSGVYLSSFR